MAALAISAYILECDACGIVFGTPHGQASAMDLRAAAYAEGWRFPNQVTQSGRTANTTSDACPNCIAEWTSQKRRSRSRAITQDELAHAIEHGRVRLSDGAA